MLVYVVRRETINSFTLPSNIYGNYWIKDINNKDLVNISEYEGKWAAFSNKNVKLIVDGKPVRSTILEEYQFLTLQVKDEPGYIVLYTCPVNDKSFTWLEVKKDFSLTVGSGKDNAIVCRNRLISPKHIELTCQKGGYLIKDLDSEYGTFVNGKLLHGVKQLQHGDVIFMMGVKIIVLGNMLILNNPLDSVTYDKRLFPDLVERSQNKEIVSSDEDKEIKLYTPNDFFIRSPRFMEVIEEVNFKFDGPPDMSEPEEMPMLLTIGPMITMASTSFVMLLVAFMSMQDGSRSGLSVMPTIAISISMMAGTLLWPTINKRYSKKQREKKLAKIDKKYNEYLVKKEQELQGISATQKQILLSNNISPVECYQMIVNGSRSLWARELHQKDFLSLRLGIGEVPLNIKFSYPEEHFTVDDNNLEEKMRLIASKYKMIMGAPIIENLINKNILAISGKYENTKPYLDLLILQIIALHSYYDLKIVLFTNEEKSKYWEYLKLMPHLFSNDKEMRFFVTNTDDAKDVSLYLQRIMSSRSEQIEKLNGDKATFYKNFGTYYLVITDDYKTSKNYPIMDEILKMDGNLGFSLVIDSLSLANLPTETKAFIGINDSLNGGIFESELQKDTQRKFSIEPVDKLNLAYCALRLINIPVENKEEDYIMPKSIGFLEMFDAGRIEQLNPLERWKSNNPILSLGVPVGIGTDGNIFKLDLHEKEEGPHGLIAGMTGSGKSEFIITYILSMAINFHPDEVQFVLIDYKGGGLVGAFENKEAGILLPHLAGTITNLDTADINRALASIESELKRRQALFNKARNQLGEGTIDIYKYQKYYREGMLDTPISHLFIISDEFAELKSQQPDFMDQLISTARIGRSLGVHLILATQKPSGVVNDQIWSNSRFRICLKVQEAADSNEVIKRPDAAAIKEVGRFYLQVGYDELFAKGQAAWAGAAYIPQDKVYHEKDDSIVFINNISKSLKTIDTPKTNLQVEGEQLPSIVKYLDTIADKENIKEHELWLPKLPDIIYVDNLKKKYNFVREPFDIRIIYGEYDNPKNQEQGILTLDLTRKGNAIIYSMNEKNTIINTLIYSLITNYTTEEVNLYIMDFDSETLKIYSEAPQVGDVIFAQEKEKVDKLLKMLTDEIEKRKKLFQEYNGSFEFYNSHASEKVPALVYILSGYENFKEAYEEKELTLGKITRDGSKYGIYTVVTAITDRALRLSMRSNFPQIVPLKLSAAIEYNMLLGKKAPLIADIENRGVALVNDEPFEFQTASVTDEVKLIEYVKAVNASLNEQLKTKAKKVPVLPDMVTLEYLKPYLKDLTTVPIGVIEENLDIATYNFKSNLINLVNSDDNNMLVAFSNLLIKEVESLDKVETLTLDLKKVLTSSNDNYTNNQMEAFRIFNEKVFRERDNDLVVFITGFDKFMSNLEDSVKNDFLGYLTKIQELNNTSIVIISKILDLKVYAFENWFRQMVSTDNGIWLGRGLNNSTVHTLSTPLRVLNMMIPPNFGYLIKAGTAIRIKVLEGEVNSGE